MFTRKISTFVLIAFLLAACGNSAQPTVDPNAIMTVAFATVNAASTQTAMAQPTSTPTETPPPTQTPLPKALAFEPTVVLSATVSAPANCRFGPSTTYAGPGGLRTGKIVQVIGRDASNQWLLVRRDESGKKACWVFATNLSVQGDINTLAVAPVDLAITPNYPAPANIRAVRAGDQVQVSWDAVTVQPKDIYLDSSYFIEAWVCSGGQLVYTIFATKDTSIAIPDQAGCAEASHALLYTTTRDGYSAPASIPWPTP
jgi:uncharacterized protein YgiM (DUF1202 family)